jgi:hypothetical protein
MVGVRVRHEDLGQSAAAKRRVNRINVARIADTGVDERRHTAFHEPRPVAGPGHRARVERVERNGNQKNTFNRA